MSGEKLKLCGIELEPWKRKKSDNKPSFFRKGPYLRGAHDDIESISKIILAHHPMNPLGDLNKKIWRVYFWDELESFRPHLDTLPGTLSPEEAMKEVDDFLVRMDKLWSFQ